MQYLINQKKIHYSWIIAFTGLFVLLSCLGLARFAIGMLLPSMGISLDLSYSQMGLIGTGNFIGYMVAVLGSSYLTKRIGARQTITIGLSFVGISMIFIGCAIGFLDIFVLYFITGVGSALANVSMMGSVSHWFSKKNSGIAAGIMMAGNGFAIAFVGIIVPLINNLYGDEGWRTSWFIMGIISIIITIFAFVLLRNTPKDIGLSPLGSNIDTLLENDNETRCKKKDRKTIFHLGIIFLLFGTTYAVYATFIVTELVSVRGFDEKVAGNIWAIIGILSIISAPLFGWISDKLGRKVAMIIVYSLFTICYLLVAFDLSNAYLFLSIGIFGLTVWSIPTIVTATISDYFGPKHAGQVLAYVILFFSLGQIFGPMIAGFIADSNGSFKMAFGICGVLTFLAIFVSYFLNPPIQKQKS